MDQDVIIRLAMVGFSPRLCYIISHVFFLINKKSYLAFDCDICCNLVIYIYTYSHIHIFTFYPYIYIYIYICVCVCVCVRACYCFIYVHLALAGNTCPSETDSTDAVAAHPSVAVAK